ncbi:hypothetical protein Agub_g3245, partial [Astrephomene gubernaculifera]
QLLNMWRHGYIPWCFVLLSLHIVQQVLSTETVAVTALGGQPFNQFKELDKTCDKECTSHGNCNKELGECECPFGLTGPSCQSPTLPACRTTLRPGAPIFLGRSVPRNCHCYRQLLRATCLPSNSSSPSSTATPSSRCASHTVSLWGALTCFEHTSQPEEQQLSELPERLDDPAYRWQRGVVTRRVAEGGGAAAEQEAEEVRDFEPLAKPPSHDHLRFAVALSKCPNRCSDQGVCRLVGAGGSGPPTCYCQPGFAGPDCSQPAPSPLCPNDCGGRGTCVGGFCKCKPPYWGIGCGRSKAFEPVKDSVSYPYYPALKIYMYDVPMGIAGPQQFDDGDTDVYIIYQAFMRFMEAFLADTGGVRTENPHEANLFYIPTFAYYVTANLGDPTAAVARAVDWVADKFPFFKRSGGKDHFVVLTSDRGGCYLKAMPQTENLIRLVHFGLERPNITDMGPLVQNREYGCFKSSRDVVLAPFFKPKATLVREVHAQLEQPGGAEKLMEKKDVLFFFSGDVRHHEPEYSGGVRQALSALLSKTTYPDVVFKAGFQPMSAGEYEDLLARAKFCLAPYGHGWGIRLTHALMHACVPVIIQDKVRQPFEDLLHYPDFSVRVSKADIPRIVEILRAVPQEDVLRMMKENVRVYRAFIWQPELGGLAYNYTIASLRRRLSYVRGELYEAGTRRLR